MSHENDLSSRAAALRRSRSGGRRDHEERDQEEPHPRREGGVSRIFNLIVQAVPRAGTGGEPTGQAAASFVFALPERRERETQSEESITETASLATSSAPQLETSTPSRQDEADNSLGKTEDEPQAKKAPAKKSRAGKISSSSSRSSSSSSSDSSSSDSSSSEDEAVAEDKVLDRNEEEQLRVLKKKQAVRKRLKRRMKEKARRSVLKWAKELSASLHETPETEKEAEKTEAETPEGDLTETGREERSEEQSESEKDKKREVRCWTMKERLGGPVPPAAGETSAAAAGGAHKLSRQAGYTIPRVVSPLQKCYFESFESLSPTLEGCIIRCPETTQERLLFGILADAGMVLSGKQAESYTKLHFRIQKEKTHRREDYRKFNSDY